MITVVQWSVYMVLPMKLCHELGIILVVVASSWNIGFTASKSAHCQGNVSHALHVSTIETAMEWP